MQPPAPPSDWDQGQTGSRPPLARHASQPESSSNQLQGLPRGVGRGPIAYASMMTKDEPRGNQLAYATAGASGSGTQHNVGAGQFDAGLFDDSRLHLDMPSSESQDELYMYGSTPYRGSAHDSADLQHQHQQPSLLPPYMPSSSQGTFGMSQASPISPTSQVPHGRMQQTFFPTPPQQQHQHQQHVHHHHQQQQAPQQSSHDASPFSHIPQGAYGGPFPSQSMFPPPHHQSGSSQAPSGTFGSTLPIVPQHPNFMQRQDSLVSQGSQSSGGASYWDDGSDPPTGTSAPGLGFVGDDHFGLQQQTAGGFFSAERSGEENGQQAQAQGRGESSSKQTPTLASCRAACSPRRKPRAFPQRRRPSPRP